MVMSYAGKSSPKTNQKNKKHANKTKSINIHFGWDPVSFCFPFSHILYNRLTICWWAKLTLWTSENNNEAFYSNFVVVCHWRQAYHIHFIIKSHLFTVDRTKHVFELCKLCFVLLLLAFLLVQVHHFLNSVTHLRMYTWQMPLFIF